MAMATDLSSEEKELKYPSGMLTIFCVFFYKRRFPNQLCPKAPFSN